MRSNKDDTTEREEGVLQEWLEDKLELVLEGQEALGVQIGKVQEELRDFKREVDYKFEVVFEELREKPSRKELERALGVSLQQ